MQAKENCTHKWAIESPKGPWSLGTCSKCKKQDAFRNSSDITGWNPSPDKERSNKTYGKYRIPTKKEILSAISNEDKLNTKKKDVRVHHEIKFVYKTVAEALVYGRTTTRKKYELPESTLRRWIERHSGNPSVATAKEGLRKKEQNTGKERKAS